MELFKYCKAERKSFLRNFEMRFSQPGVLNDIFEGVLGASESDLRNRILPKSNAQLRQTHLPRFKGREGELEQKLHEIGEEYIASILNPTQRLDLGFSELRSYAGSIIAMWCLSKRNDSTAMWAHYAEEHKGLVFGFDSKHQFFQIVDRGYEKTRGVQGVKYEDKRPTVPILKSPDGAKRSVLVKSKEWAYEEEVRIIRDPRHADRRKTEDGIDCHLFKIPKACLTSVIFGMEMTEDKRQRIAGVIRSDSELQHVKLKEAYPSHFYYKMDVFEWPSRSTAKSFSA